MGAIGPTKEPPPEPPSPQAEEEERPPTSSASKKKRSLKRKVPSPAEEAKAKRPRKRTVSSPAEEAKAKGPRKRTVSSPAEEPKANKRPRKCTVSPAAETPLSATATARRKGPPRRAKSNLVNPRSNESPQSSDPPDRESSDPSWRGSAPDGRPQSSKLPDRRRQMTGKHKNTAEEDYYNALEDRDKTLFLTLRELVENSLDATDSIANPEIEIDIAEKDMLDAKQCNVSNAKRKPGEDIKKLYAISCKDNGVGIEDIRAMIDHHFESNLFRRQRRGKFGLGVKLPFIYAHESTCFPITVETAQSKDDQISRYLIYPKWGSRSSVKRKKMDNEELWAGTLIYFFTRGIWKEKEQMITHYLELIPIVNQNITIRFIFTSHQGCKVQKEYFGLGFGDRILKPNIVPLDPRTINLANLRKAKQGSQQKTLDSFLKLDFMDIDDKAAEEMIKKMKVEPETELAGITDAQLVKLHKILEKHKYDDENKNENMGLSPIGNYFKLGVENYAGEKVVVLSLSKRAGSFKGHPFLVEALISIGSEKMKKGLNIYRFVNRAPLVLEEDADLITKVVKEIEWKKYNIILSEDIVGVFVSIVGSEMPYNSILKEYLRNYVVEKIVKETMIRCCENMKRGRAVNIYKEEKDMDAAAKIFRTYLRRANIGNDLHSNRNEWVRKVAEENKFNESDQRKVDVTTANESDQRKVDVTTADESYLWIYPQKSAEATALDGFMETVAERTDAIIKYKDISYNLDDPTPNQRILDGRDVVESFCSNRQVEKEVVLFWAKILSYRDKSGKKVFLHTQLTEWLIERDDALKAKPDVDPHYAKQPDVDPHYAKQISLQLLKASGDVSNAELIFIPILYFHDYYRKRELDNELRKNGHWLVFCLNIKEERIDVMDSLNAENHDYSHKVLSRLDDLFLECWKEAPKFSSWKKKYIKVQQQQKLDCGIYVMKFMEYWNGEEIMGEIESHKMDVYRLEYYQYMVDHELNERYGEVPGQVPKCVFKERPCESKKIKTRQITEFPLGKTTLLKYKNTGREIELNGEELHRSFTQGNCIEDTVMDFFCRALFDDDSSYIDTDISFHPRVFLDTSIYQRLLLKGDVNKAALKNCGLDASLGQTKLTFLPFKQDSHWWLYCLNAKKKQIDVFDLANEKNKSHRGNVKIFISRLVLALQEILPIPNFDDWVWNDSIGSGTPVNQDHGIFIMKYMECWDGEALNCNIDLDKDDEYREIYMNYMLSHRNNLAPEIKRLKDMLSKGSFDEVKCAAFEKLPPKEGI